MKSFLRWSATLGLAGGVLLGTLLSSAQRVLALTDEQVAERLRPVPVFTLTDDRGAPLVASPPQGEQGPSVARVFISQQDAQAFLNTLRQANPQAAQGVAVRLVSLAEVFQLAQTSQAQQIPLRFGFVPQQQQVQTAQTILQQSGQPQQEFNGVPLFVAQSDAQNGGYLTIQQGDQQVIPMYFVREELQAMLDRLRQQQPDLAAQMSVHVINLEGLIQTLKSTDDPNLPQIVIVPSRETLEYIRTNAPQEQQPAQGQPRPQAAPSTPARPATP